MNELLAQLDEVLTPLLNKPARQITHRDTQWVQSLYENERTLELYLDKGMEPPVSYLEYVQQQIRLAMPQPAYEAVDGGL